MPKQALSLKELSDQWYQDAAEAYNVSSVSQNMRGHSQAKVVKEAWMQGWVERHTQDMY